MFLQTRVPFQIARTLPRTFQITRTLPRTYVQRLFSVSAAVRTENASVSEDLWPSMVIWNKFGVASTEKLASDIASCTNVETTLDLLGSEKSLNEIRNSPELLCIALKNLIFKQLITNEQMYPCKVWLQKDISTALSQFRKSPRDWEIVFQELTEHDTFKLLVNIVEKSLPNLPAKCLSELFVILLLSGTLQHDNTLLCKLYVLVRRQLWVSNWKDVVLFLRYGVTSADYKTGELVLKQIRQQLEQEESQCVTANDVLHLMSVTGRFTQFMTAEMWRLFTKQLYKTSIGNGWGNDGCVLASMCSTLSDICNDAPMYMRSGYMNLISSLLEALRKSDHTFSAIEAKRVQACARKVSKAVGTTDMFTFQTTSTFLDGCQLKDLLNVHEHVILSPDRRIIRLWRSLVSEHIEKHGVPPTLRRKLMSLVNYRGWANGMPRSITHELFQCLLQDPQWYSRLHLQNLNAFFTDRELSQLVEMATEATEQAIDNFRFMVLVSFVLKAGTGTLPESIWNRVPKIISNSDGKSINQVFYNGGFAIPLLRTLCGAAISTRSVNEVLIMFTMKGNKAPMSQGMRNLAIQRILELIGNGSVPDAYLETITRLFHTQRYFSPVVMDSFAGYIKHAVIEDAIEDHGQYGDGEAFMLLQYAAFFCYRPDDLLIVLPDLLKHYDKAKQQGRHLYAVRMLHNLSQLGIYPIKELRELFSVDSMTQIHTSSKDWHQQDNLHIKFIIASLNRVVILDCPKVEVPWFCKGILLLDDIKDISQGWLSSSPKEAEKYAEVYDILAVMFGGRRYVKHKTVVEYDYEIQNLVAFSSGSNVLPIADPSYKYTGNEIRVAFEVVTQISGTEGRRTTGEHVVKMRHLQQLGYEVIMIYMHDWNRLKNQEAQRDYICTRLYGAQNAKDSNRYHPMADTPPQLSYELMYV